MGEKLVAKISRKKWTQKVVAGQKYLRKEEFHLYSVKNLLLKCHMSDSSRFFKNVQYFLVLL